MRQNVRAQYDVRNRHVVGLGIVQAIVNHSLRARPVVLGGLERKDYSPQTSFRGQRRGPLPRLVGTRCACHGRRRANGLVHAVGVGYTLFARVRETYAFCDREEIEVGTKEDDCS
jgi:hypothetical protein